MAQRFLLQCALWALPIIIGLGGYVSYNRAYIAAPRYTSNLALNEQVQRIVDLPEKSTDMLAVGSSMTLNNLASSVVVDHFGTKAYQNAGAWGMGVKETSQLLPALVDRLAPSKVIMVTNLMDLRPGASLSQEEVDAIGRKLRDGGSTWDYLRYWDAPWFLRQMELNRIRFNDPGNYEYLGFDEHGGAMLEVSSDRILRSWFDEKPPEADYLDSAQYAEFASIAIWLRERGIDLIVLRSPYREGLRTPALKELDRVHSARLERILADAGHQFVDGTTRAWPDSLFNDASHFDRIGAESFTRWALDRLED